jgi:hypothetical protein
MVRVYPIIAQTRWPKPLSTHPDHFRLKGFLQRWGRREIQAGYCHSEFADTLDPGGMEINNSLQDSSQSFTLGSTGYNLFFFPHFQQPTRDWMIMKTHLGLTTFFLFAILLSAAPAQAYIDPGTGSFLVQGIIAAVVGTGVAIKMFWGRIKAALTGSKPVDDDDDE